MRLTTALRELLRKLQRSVAIAVVYRGLVVLPVVPIMRTDLNHLRHNLVDKQVLSMLYELAMGRFVFHTANCVSRCCSRRVLL